MCGGGSAHLLCSTCLERVWKSFAGSDSLAQGSYIQQCIFVAWHFMENMTTGINNSG